MNNILKGAVGLVAFIITFTFLTKYCSPDYIEKETTTEISIDSTLVDSLHKRIQYLEELPPVIVRDTIEIPVPISEPDGTVTYNFPYSDSLLSARFTVNTETKTTFNSVTLDYTLRRYQRVIKDTDTIILTKFQTKTTTKTLIENPKPYFTIGFEAGTMNYLSPTIGFVTKNKFHIRYRYGLQTSSHNVGISIPIKF